MNGDLTAQVLASLATARSDDNLIGSALRTPQVRALSVRYYRQIGFKNKLHIFTLCDELLSARDSGARLIAFDWAFRIRKEYLETDFAHFESWLRDYVNDWGSCDDFCTHAFGALLFRFPYLFPNVRAWTPSSNRWLRRAAAVVLIFAVRRRMLFTEAFTMADLLLADDDDLVRKGYGWLLKEVSKHDPQAVFDYIMCHKGEMPRVSLRYAIEKLDPELRQQAMTR